MIGRGFNIFGMTGSRRFMVSDGSRGGLPPLPVVDDTAAMMRDLDKEHGRVSRIGATYCVILVRLDNVQESELASQIVDGVGKRFAVSLRPYDSIYRFGPDMFLIGVSHIKTEDATVIMDRLRTVVSSRLLTMDDGSVVPATASVGAIMLEGQFSVQEHLDRAGRALYAATQNGGDSIRLWSPDLESA